MGNLVKKKGNVNGRRINALKLLEASLANWRKHDKPKEYGKIGGPVLTRTHEQEEARILREIENVKKHLAGQF